MKTGYRKGDNAPMAVIELVLEPVSKKPASSKKSAARAEVKRREGRAEGRGRRGDDRPRTAAEVTEEVEATEVPVEETVEVEPENTEAEAADEALPTSRPGHRGSE